MYVYIPEKLKPAFLKNNSLEEYSGTLHSVTITTGPKFLVVTRLTDQQF